MMNVQRKLIPWVLLALVTLPTACDRPPDYQATVMPPGLTDPKPAINEDYLLNIDTERVHLTREYLSIHHPEFAKSLPPENIPESIAFEPKLIVVHYTAIPTLKEVMDYFQPNQIESARETIRKNGLLNVGIQFVVDQDGTIYRSYPENLIARHTIGLNHAAIGIENVGNGDLNDPQATTPLTQAQLDSNIALVSHLASKYPSILFLIGHQEYQDLEDPRHPAHKIFYEQFPAYRTEKIDPGDNFLSGLRTAIQN